MEIEVYGTFALTYSIFLLLAGFHNAMILEPMSVIGPVKYSNSLGKYFRKTANIHFGVTLLISGITLIIALIFKSLILNSVYYEAMLSISISLPFILLFWLCRRAYYLQNKPEGATWLSILYSILTIACIVILKLHNLLNLINIFFTLGFTSLLVSLLGYKRLTKNQSILDKAIEVNSNKIINENWKYGKWVVLITIVHWISGNLYYLLTAGILGIEEVGALRAIQNLIFPIGQVLTALGVFFLPWASQQTRLNSINVFSTKIVKISVFMLLITSTYALLIIVFGRYIVNYIYNNEYDSFAYLLPFFVIPPIITALGTGLQIGIKALQLPSKIFSVNSSGAVLTIIFGTFLVKYYGLTGVAVGILLVSLVQIVLILKFWNNIIANLKR